MMPTVAKKQVSRVETDLDVTDYLGVNQFGAESTIGPGEFLSCKNLDLYRNGFMPNRYGSEDWISSFLTAGVVLNGVLWDTGVLTYVIVQQQVLPTTSKFRVIPVEPIGAYATVQDYGGGDLTISHASTPTSASMMISNDRLYVFHEDGNLIVEFDGVSAFKGRSLGIETAEFDSANPVFPSGAGAFTGTWNYGVEVVYRRSGSDFASSGISRVYDDGALATANGSNIGGFFVKVLAGSLVLPAGIPTGSLTDGMCVRIWRSKNQEADTSNPLDPIDAQGTPDEFYPRVLLTVDALVAALYVYSDFDLSDDPLPKDTTTIVEVATIQDYVGLQKLPNAAVGTYHRDRIWLGNAPSVDATRSKLIYSATAGTPYQEQYNALNLVPAEAGDGQYITSLISLERDLIVIKEGKTLRIQDGDPLNKAETLDYSIGIKKFRLSKFIPGVGIIAIATLTAEAMIFGYDLKWSNLFGDQDISKKIQGFTASLGDLTSILFCNGKVFLVKGETAQTFVLHVDQAKGWTEYAYKLTSAELVVSSRDGSHLYVISGGTKVIALERRGNTGFDFNTTTNANEPIVCSWKTHRYQMEGGRLMMEYRYYSVIAQLSTVMYGMSYVNGTPWPDPAGTFAAGKVAMIPDPTMYNPQNALKETDYKLFLPPPRPCANLFGFEFETLAPCTIRSQRLNCIALTAQLNPAFDPYALMRFRPLGPPWAKPSAPSWQSEIRLSLIDMGTTVVDTSGRQRTHVFSTGGGPGFVLASLPVMFPGIGGRVTNNATSGTPGWGPAPGVTYDAMETMGAAPTVTGGDGYTTWKMVLRLTGAFVDGVIAQGGNGDEFWQLSILNESGAFSGQLEFRTYRGGTVARAWRSLDVVPNNQGDNRLILMFSYLNTGDPNPANDNFVLFMDDSGSQWGGRRRTTVESFDPTGVVVTTHALFPGQFCDTRDISTYQIETGLANEVEAKRFFEVMKNGDEPFIGS